MAQPVQEKRPDGEIGEGLSPEFDLLVGEQAADDDADDDAGADPNISAALASRIDHRVKSRGNHLIGLSNGILSNAAAEYSAKRASRVPIITVLALKGRPAWKASR
ncbi:hypothetical protein D3C83_35300 [compost metagenome]